MFCYQFLFKQVERGFLCDDQLSPNLENRNRYGGRQLALTYQFVNTYQTLSHFTLYPLLGAGKFGNN